MICKKCGEKIPDGLKICNNCGTDNGATANTSFRNLRSDRPVQTSESRKKRKICQCCGRSVLEGERFCSNCGHDVTKRPSALLWRLQDIAEVLAIGCVIMCLLPMVEFAPREYASVIMGVAFLLEKDVLSKIIGLLCCILIILPVAIAINAGIAKRAVKHRGKAIACVALGVALTCCLYEARKMVDMLGDLTIVYMIFLVASIVIIVISFICIFLRK